MKSLCGLLEVQQRWSSIPRADELLIEAIKTHDGHQIFAFPMEGRLVHEGLAAIVAYRISRTKKTTFSMACNDHGFVLQSPHEVDLSAALSAGIFSSTDLISDILSSMNETEMAKRQFRQIARVAGLIQQGYPGMRKTASHFQASSNLFFDVFNQYDADNLLLKQAHREVLDQQLEAGRLVTALDRIANCRIVIERPQRVTPFAFPLLVDKLRERVSSESLSDRITRMQAELEQAADRTT